MNLLLCPFCGARPEFRAVSIDSNNIDYDIACKTKDCFLEFGGGWSFGTKEQAAEIWNNRKYRILEIL